MVKCGPDGVIITNHATAQDILNLAQAIHTANSIKLRDGYVISNRIINNMINALGEATESYRESIKEDRA